MNRPTEQNVNRSTVQNVKRPTVQHPAKLVESDLLRYKFVGNREYLS